MVEEPGMCGSFLGGNREIPRLTNRGKAVWSASGRRGAVADDARTREVRLCHSSGEVCEQGLPAEGDERLESMPSTIEEIRSALLEAFDRQHQIDAAALLVMRHLTLGHPPELIISALARALLREDAGFHAYQMLEAGVRQFGEWGNTEPGRHILVAVARYLAAHSPTERGWLQTADIAARLSRGDQLHADAPPAD